MHKRDEAGHPGLPGIVLSSAGLGVLVPRRESVGTGLLAQIAACKREVASWPDWMRTVAVLRIHPAAMEDANEFTEGLGGCSEEHIND